MEEQKEELEQQLRAELEKKRREAIQAAEER